MLEWVVQRGSKSLCAWRSQNVPNWTWSWTICSGCPCLSSGFWTKWPPEVPSNLNGYVIILTCAKWTNLFAVYVFEALLYEVIWAVLVIMKYRKHFQEGVYLKLVLNALVIWLSIVLFLFHQWFMAGFWKHQTTLYITQGLTWSVVEIHDARKGIEK